MVRAHGLGLLPLLLAAAAVAADGDLDPGFADGGRLVLAPPDASLRGVAAATTADGRLLLAGSRWYVGETPFINEVAVWRLLADGTFDTAFGEDGRAAIDFGDEPVVPAGIAVDAPGRILVAASGDDLGFGVLRFGTDGQPDAGFGVDGRVSVDFTDLGYGAAFAFAIASDASGRILVVGSAHSGNAADAVVVRLSQDGVPDASFGTAGRVIVPLDGGFDARQAWLYDIAPTRHGGVLAAGAASTGEPQSWSGLLVLRLLPDGSFDPAFADGGIARFAPRQPAGGDVAMRVFAVHDGVLAAGSCGWGDDGDMAARFCALRLHADGSVDETYGDHGWAQFAAQPRVLRRMSAALQGDRRLVFAGTAMDEEHMRFAIARLDPFGAPDAIFGGGSGHVEIAPDPSAAQSSARAVTLQAGRIVVAGDTDGVPSIRALAAIRLDNDGIFIGSFD